MTEALKIEFDEQVVRKFKKKAFGTYGYKKDVIKKAIEEILKNHTSENKARPEWSRFFFKILISCPSLFS